MIERTFIEQGMKNIQIAKYLKKKLDRAGFTGLHIVKTPLVTRIVLNVARPGLAIGKGGQNIRQLTEDIGTKFGIDNPQIEIQDIKNPALDAKATVDKMVELIERGFSWKSVAFRTIRDINEAGAQGVELILKGKLSGKGGRKRKHRVVQGYMKKVGNQVKLVDMAKASAYPKAGAIGIKLSIIRPEVIFPDKLKIAEEIQKKKAEETESEKEKAVDKKKEKQEAEKEKPAEKKKETEKEKKEKPAEKKEKKETKGKEKSEKKKETRKEKEEKKSKEKTKTAKEKKPKKEEKKKAKKQAKKSDKP